MGTYTKEQTVEVAAPLEGVKPTVFTSQLKVDCLVSTVAKACYFKSEAIDMSAYNEMCDIPWYVQARTLQNSAISNTATVYWTLTSTGKLTCSAAPDASSVTVYNRFTLTGVSSLKSILLMTTAKQFNRGSNQYPYINVTVDGTLVAGEIPFHDMHPVVLTRDMFVSATTVVIDVVYATLESANASYQIFNPAAFEPIYAEFDFKNSAEGLTAPLLGGVTGGLLGLSASLNQDTIRDLTSQITSNPSFNSALANVATGFGVTISSLVTGYLTALAYGISKGWCTWEDFSLEDMVTGLTSPTSILSGLGNIGTQFITGAISNSRLSAVLNGLVAGVGSYAVSSAYLLLLNKRKHFSYQETYV